MTDALYDKILLVLAQLAPVTLIFLSGWYASWDTWYIPLDDPRNSFSEATFAEKADQWLQGTHSSGVTYYVFVDPLCPCTNPTLQKLQSAITQSNHPDANIVTIDITLDKKIVNNTALSALIHEIPAVPMVIAAQEKNLIYTGPVNAGNFCTTQVDQTLPVIATANTQSTPIHNWLSQGCYCQAHAQPIALAGS